MYKGRSRYLKYLQQHGHSKGIDVPSYIGKGPVDIYRQDSDYFLRIQDRTINLGFFNSRKEAQQYARKKIKAAFGEERLRSKYIRKIDGKLFNKVPETIFLQKF